MHMLPSLTGDKKIYFGVIYVMVSIPLFAVINYITWTEGVLTDLSVSFLLCYVFIYAPLFIYYIAAQWKIREFGFIVNTKVILFFFLSLVVGSYFFVKGLTIDTGKWEYSLIEAFARTGEELYFRGFTYLLVLKLFKHKKNWMWAVFLSSLAFALVHTQVLLPGYTTSFFQVFIIGLFLAYFRHITDSLLPGVTIHCFLKGGLSTVLFGWVIYALFVTVSYFKNGKVE